MIRGWTLQFRIDRVWVPVVALLQVRLVQQTVQFEVAYANLTIGILDVP